jgi:hypothetical protein
VHRLGIFRLTVSNRIGVSSFCINCKRNGDPSSKDCDFRVLRLFKTFFKKKSRDRQSPEQGKK